MKALGGFKVSFVTDNIQGVMVLGLIIMGVIAVGVETDIDRSLIDQSGYLKPSLLGWQLIYILPVAILTNDFFLSGFWMRTFASRTDKDLWIGVSLASAGVLIILTLVGLAGLLAAWSGAYEIGDEENGALSLFLLLGQLPAWVVGVILVMVVSLSTAAFDSFQSAMISTGSNDLFRNKLNIWVIRGCVVLLIFPVVVVALRSPDILQIFLISDLVSAAVVPCLVIGLSEKFYWYRGFDFVVGGLGGIFTIFLFGLVYYDGDVTQASKLLLLENGLYANDWSAFGKLQYHIPRVTGANRIRGVRCCAIWRSTVGVRSMRPSPCIPLCHGKGEGSQIRCSRSTCTTTRRTSWCFGCGRARHGSGTQHCRYQGQVLLGSLRRSTRAFASVS
jgi:hypothetical protein